MTTQAEDLALTRLRLELGDAYLKMVDEFEAAGEGYPYNNIELARENFAAYVQELDDEEHGIGIPPGIPSQVTYVLVRNGQTVLGELRFRARTAPGQDNIGYNVRPSERRRGYASYMLAKVLDLARELGLSEVLLTVEGENPGSVGTITKNGGRLERQVADPGAAPISFYLIPV